MNIESIVFLIILFIVAMLYSSVGHGGASGYLALMGLFHFTPDVMRPSALILNIFVSFVAWWQYSRTEDLNKKLFFWLIAGSIPTAYLGALITIDTTLYKQLLGCLLFLPAARLLGWFPYSPNPKGKPTYPIALLFGIIIGFISGVIGIGGGIILSPLLLSLGWSDIKQTALISALFICLNSISGIAGILTSGLFPDPVLYLWIAVATAGGLFGAWMGSHKLTPIMLKRVLGIVLIIAGGKLIFF